MDFFNRHRQKIIISLIILLGAIIRIINIDQADFWRDEAFTLRAAVMNFGDMWSALTNDTAPPLYTVIMHYWLQIFPLNEFWARIPSYIFGVATIYSTYLLAKQLFPYNRKYVYLSTLLVALNPVLIFYSQEARAYSLLSLLATVSLYLVIKLTDIEKAKSRDWIYLIMVTILGLYTHNLFIFIAFVNALILFGYRFKFRNLKQTMKLDIPLFLSYLVAGVAFLPWFFIFLEQSSTVSEGGFWLVLEPIRDPINLLRAVFSGEQIWVDNETARNVLKFITDILAGIFILGGVITIYKQRKNDKFNQKLLVLLFWTIANFLIVYFYSFKTSFVYIRYLIYLVVPVSILTLIPILNTKLPKYLQYWVAAFVITTLAVLSFVTLNNIPSSKAQMRALVEQVEALDTEDTFILHPHAYTYHGFDLYSELDSKVYDPNEDLPYYEGLAALNEDDYYRDVEIPVYEQVFAIYLWEADPALTEELEKNYQKTDNYDYQGNLHLEIWQKLHW